MDSDRQPLALLRMAKRDAYAAFKASSTPWNEVNDWCEENCATYGVNKAKLRSWIANAAADELAMANLNRQSDAQKTARLVGATLPRALKTLSAALSASKIRIKVDRHGKETGRVEIPDHEARISASKEILKVLGAYAPEKMEVLAGPLDEFAALTDEQLKREIAKYRNGSGAETLARIDGEDGGEQLLSLDNGSDGDSGRPRSGEPVQAISKATLFPAITECLRQ